MDWTRDRRKGTSIRGPITFFENLRRLSSETQTVCGICRVERRALRQCSECGFIFCSACLLKLFNITGAMAGAFSQCPDCTGTDLSDVIF